LTTSLVHPDLVPHSAALLALPDLVRRVQPKEEELMRRVLKRAFAIEGVPVVDEHEHFLLVQLPNVLQLRLKFPPDDPHVVAARELARLAEIRSTP
jgi:hypothetical protein